MSARNDYADELYRKGREALLDGDLEASTLRLQEALSAYKTLGEHTQFARTLNLMGVAYSDANNDIMAVDCYLQGLAHVKQFKVRGVANIFYNNIGTRYEELGDYKTALEYFKQAEEDMLSSGVDTEENADWYIVSYLNLGVAYWHTDDLLNAEMALLKAQELMKKYGSHTYDFSVETIMSHLNLHLGKPDYAKEHLPMLLECARTKNEEPMSDYSQDFLELVELLKDMEDYDHMLEAIRYFEANVDEQPSVQLKLQLTEHYMTYYRCI